MCIDAARALAPAAIDPAKRGPVSLIDADSGVVRWKYRTSVIVREYGPSSIIPFVRVVVQEP